jgi:hypothetical protein
MIRRSGVIGLALAALLVANGLVKTVSADIGACKPVKVCAPVTTAPAVPVCKPVKVLPLPEVCKPVKALPTPGACKPVKEYGCVGAHPKHVILKNHVARFASHFRKHGIGKEVSYDTPQPVPSPTSPTPAPAPQPPTS